MGVESKSAGKPPKTTSVDVFTPGKTGFGEGITGVFEELDDEGLLSNLPPWALKYLQLRRKRQAKTGKDRFSGEVEQDLIERAKANCE